MSEGLGQKRTGALACHRDERGYLISLEFAEIPFPVRRSFAVVAPAGNALRGGHAPRCRQLLVLTAGKVTAWVTPAGGAKRAFQLSLPGEYVFLEADDYIEYEMTEERSSILVLAERSYAPVDGK
jgi:hypothetical protein